MKNSIRPGKDVETNYSQSRTDHPFTTYHQGRLRVSLYVAKKRKGKKRKGNEMNRNRKSLNTTVKQYTALVKLVDIIWKGEGGEREILVKVKVRFVLQKKT